jgi:hypothetical protein
MEMRWVAGGPVRDGEPSPEDRPADEMNPKQLGAAAIKPPRPSQKSHRRYMRERLTADLPAIADSLLKEARDGKLPVQMSGMDEKKSSSKPARYRGRSFAEILMDDWRKEPVDGDGSELTNRRDDLGHAPS